MYLVVCTSGCVAYVSPPTQDTRLCAENYLFPNTMTDPTIPNPPSSGASTLKSCQLAAVSSMLGTHNNSNAPWKILIYDAHTRSIISPILSVSSLRSLGVTLHLMLHSDREAIPDVPAVYFVAPTQENLDRVARDCSRRLYQCARLNACGRMERQQMEQFAAMVVSTNGLSQVESLVDNYLDFVSLEERLFHLGVGESYIAYNHHGATEADVSGSESFFVFVLFQCGHQLPLRFRWSELWTGSARGFSPC